MFRTRVVGAFYLIRSEPKRSIAGKVPQVLFLKRALVL